MTAQPRHRRDHRLHEPPGAECAFCDQRLDGETIYEDRLWSLRRMDGPPGWLTLWSRRHVESLDELDPAQLASLGPMLARVTAAIRRAVGAEKVYVEIQGERIAHLHVMLLARTPDVAPEHRGPALLAARPSLRADEAVAAAAARRIATCLRERAAPDAPLHELGDEEPPDGR